MSINRVDANGRGFDRADVDGGAAVKCFDNPSRPN
jgi:hypothetical protein